MFHTYKYHMYIMYIIFIRTYTNTRIYAAAYLSGSGRRCHVDGRLPARGREINLLPLPLPLPPLLAAPRDRPLRTAARAGLWMDAAIWRKGAGREGGGRGQGNCQGGINSEKVFAR